MNKLNNKSGFTLIEIIVVLIIVGVLAAIALPNLFSNIQKSKSAQALTMVDSLKTSMESCLNLNSTVTPGGAPCTAAILFTPSNGNGWSYTLGTGTAQGANLGGTVASAGSYAAGTATYSIVATDGLSTASSLSLTRSTAGIWTCNTGTASPYLGVC